MSAGPEAVSPDPLSVLRRNQIVNIRFPFLLIPSALFRERFRSIARRLAQGGVLQQQLSPVQVRAVLAGRVPRQTAEFRVVGRPT